MVPREVILPQIEALEFIAPLVARGLMAREEALPHLVAAAWATVERRRPDYSRQGLAVEIGWSFEQAIRDVERGRARAQSSIPFALRPLRDRRAKSAELLARAAALNAEGGGWLDDGEVHDLVVGAVERAAAFQRWGRR